MITLYSKDFSTKYGVISSLCEAFVEEERNGLFELSFIMLNTDSLFKYIKEENIVVANANDTLLNQKFRIYMTRKLMNNRVEVFARHISFDLMYDYIDNLSFENQSCEYALNQLFRNSNFSTHYRGYSDIVNAQNYNMSMANVLEAIGGKKGSIIDTFGTGAEILRDNENIHVLNKRGYDNEVTIEYKKNLTGFELEEDATDLVTRILPYAKYNDENNGEVIVKADYVDSPLIANYSHPYIASIDYSNKFENDEIPTISKLQELARKEYRDNKVDIPKQNFKVEFIPLSKCVGYEGLEDKISLCDTVTIVDTRYNINTQAKIIKTVFNVLKNRYESMELGEPRTSLGDIVGNGGDNEPIVGPPGPQGPPGQDGSIGDFPNSLPPAPIVTATVYGFANIEISWTFENKVYYQYEVYASKEVDFIPNTFNLIHQGQTSTFMYQAKPNETWYFKVCCVNSHGERTSFGSAYATTTKVSDLSNYVSEMAIDDALIGNLRLDRGWIGQLNANLLDVKGNFSVTDGNGKRTLDIDSFGNVSLDVANFKLKSKNIATEDDVNNLSYRVSEAESKITDEAITNTVSKSFYTKGDIDNKGYQTSSQVQQTVDNLQFKFSQSGGYNLIRNSAFKNGLKYWTAIRWDNSAGGNHNIQVEQVGSYWTISNRNSINVYVDNLTSNSLGKPLNAGFDSDLFPVNEGSTYTLNCLLAVHRAYGVTIEMLCYNSNGDRLVGNNSIYISGIKMGGKDRNNWTPVKHTFTTQQGATHCRLRLFLGEWTGESDNVHVWLAEPIVTEGSSSVMWTPSADEVYDGITIIDKDGIQVQHHDNSFSRFNSSEMYQTNENGDRALSIRHGGYRVYQFDYNGNTASAYLGSIASTYLSSGRVYGTGIFGTANSGYIDIGFSESSQDNQHTGISPWLRCSHYDGASGLPAGIHSFKPFYAHDYSYYYARPRFFYGIAFPYDEREDLNEEISNITTSSSDTSSIGSRYLNIWGADGINIGVQNNGNYTGHKIIEDSSGAKLHHESWGDWDFHWWTMRNINIANTLSDPSALIDSREHKYTRESHNIMSTKKLIQDRGEDFTMDGSCIVEIPNDIKYSISRYDVNIIKYGRGDIWVSERTHDYFVVESENDIKFTWVLEGETLDTSTVSSITPYNIEEDSSEIKPKTREVFGTIPSSKYATMDD